MASETNTDSFTQEEDVKLVELMKQHPFLYDQRHDDAKKQGLRETAWKNVCEELNKSGEDCKKRWKNIIDTYNKHRRNNKLRSGQNKPTKWALAECLTFLDEDTSDRNEQMTISLVDEKDTSSSGKSSEGDEDDCVIVTEENGQQLTNSIPAQSGCKSANCKRSLNNNGVRFCCKKAKQNNVPIPTRSNSNRAQEEVIRRVTVANHDDPVDAFFKCMAYTVNTFPHHLKIKAKHDVFKIINSLELESSKTASK